MIHRVIPWPPLDCVETHRIVFPVHSTFLPPYFLQAGRLALLLSFPSSPSLRRPCPPPEPLAWVPAGPTQALKILQVPLVQHDMEHVGWVRAVRSRRERQVPPHCLMVKYFHSPGEELLLWAPPEPIVGTVPATASFPGAQAALCPAPIC